MNRTVAGVVSLIAGVFLAGAGVSRLTYYRSFTETAVGKVDRLTPDGFVVVTVGDRVRKPGGNVERAFPLAGWDHPPQVGGWVMLSFPPNRPSEARRDGDFPYVVPAVLIGVGAAFLLSAAGLLRKKRPSAMV